VEFGYHFFELRTKPSHGRKRSEVLTTIAPRESRSKLRDNLSTQNPSGGKSIQSDQVVHAAPVEGKPTMFLMPNISAQRCLGLKELKRQGKTASDTSANRIFRVLLV
jgi:hypothetical protein